MAEQHRTDPPGNEQTGNEAERTSRTWTGAGIAIGAGIGAAAGIALDQAAVGVAVGVAIGAAVGTAVGRRSRKGSG